MENIIELLKIEKCELFFENCDLIEINEVDEISIFIEKYKLNYDTKILPNRCLVTQEIKILISTNKKIKDNKMGYWDMSFTERIYAYNDIVSIRLYTKEKGIIDINIPWEEDTSGVNNEYQKNVSYDNENLRIELGGW